MFFLYGKEDVAIMKKCWENNVCASNTICDWGNVTDPYFWEKLEAASIAWAISFNHENSEVFMLWQKFSCNEIYNHNDMGNSMDQFHTKIICAKGIKQMGM